MLNTPYEETVEFQLERDEALVQLRRLMMPLRLNLILILIFMLGLMIIILWPAQTIWAVGIMIFPLFFLLCLRLLSMKLITQHPELIDKQIVIFNHHAISIKNNVASLQWQWEKLHRMVNCEDYILLRFDSMGSGTIIPKRAMTKEQIDRILLVANGKH